jgi:uncharacterized protein (TIGR00375 family)
MDKVFFDSNESIGETLDNPNLIDKYGGMNFITDFHIHSKFSRATSKLLDLEHLYISAQLKGITVIGTGDFTHPDWFAEISEKLVPAETGLYKLNPDIARACDEQVPKTCRQAVRFILTTEISNIYKKRDKTRKNHNLVFVPDLEVADSFNARLEKIGNIRSDGRPILGLDARNLLEIVLETNEDAFLVPAHIWTPWFSMLGSKSGFDSIRGCFEDLTDYIFAVETGLSSDPPMNWRVSDLDHLTLISNSDAHSPDKLGREANLFDTDLSYHAIRSAMKNRDPQRFLGTIEFFPEEGKYHLDGHRKCDVRMWPTETIKKKQICPQCGKAVTCGVLHRVEELADRPEDFLPEDKSPYYNQIPLKEVLAEIFDVGPATKRVARSYQALLERYGSELSILRRVPIVDLNRSGIPMLGTAINRIRQNRIDISPGYDGEFGKIKIFSLSERKKISAQRSLFTMPAATQDVKKRNKPNTESRATSNRQQQEPQHRASARLKNEEKKNQPRIQYKQFVLDNLLYGLNPQQCRAVEHIGSPMLIVAGPGTGKTRTLTHRIAHLVTRSEIPSENILAVTFTNKASQEMRHRLQALLNNDAPLPDVLTFHAFCLKVLTEIHLEHSFSIIDDLDRKELIAKAVQLVKMKGLAVTQHVNRLSDLIVSAKQLILLPEEIEHGAMETKNKTVTATVYRKYQQMLAAQHLYDYEDLIFEVVRLFESDDSLRLSYQKRYKHILVDEYQDLNSGQYRLVRALSPPGKDLFVIGDPDQAIYGFRGSDVKYFNKFIEDYPDATVVRLEKNYRSTQTILSASHQVITSRKDGDDDHLFFNRSRIYSDIEGMKTIGIIESSTERAEAVAVGKIIENMIGGIGFYSVDFGKTDGSEEQEGYGFSDFAVLSRAGFQCDIIAETFEKAGIPYQRVAKKSALHDKGRNIIFSLLKIYEGVGNYLDLERSISYTNYRIPKSVITHFVGWGIEHNLSLNMAQQKIRLFPLPGVRATEQRKLASFEDAKMVWREETLNFTIREKLRRAAELLNSKYIKKFGDPFERAEEFFIASGESGSAISEYISKTALKSDTDLYEDNSEKVSLLTLHASKGLEFPVVFITGCEEGLIPFLPPDGQDQNREEERRLFYVAMTRARDVLYLTHAKRRRRLGKMRETVPSPFLKDIESRLMNVKRSNRKTKLKTDDGPVQLALFD